MSKEKLMLASERKAMMAEELPKLKLRARSTLAQAEDVVSAVMDDWLRERRARRKKARERKERVLDGLREFGAPLDRIGGAR